MFNPFPLHLALPFYGRVPVWLALKPAWGACHSRESANPEFFIPYYSYMDLSSKIRLPSVVLTKEGVNPRKSVVKIIKSTVKINKMRANLRNLRIKSIESADIFMQNKANFQKAKIILTPYMTNRYVNICSLSQPKNKAKTKPNKAKSNPILTQINTKQSQSNPIYSELVEPIKPNLFNCVLIY